jgi:hypothetical protein
MSVVVSLSLTHRIVATYESWDQLNRRSMDSLFNGEDAYQFTNVSNMKQLGESHNLHHGAGTHIPRSPCCEVGQRTCVR